MVKEVKGFCFNGIWINIKYYYRGFMSQSVRNYDINDDNYDKYMSDYDRLYINCNSDYRVMMDNKLVYHYTFSNYLPLPKVYFIIENKQIRPFGNGLKGRSGLCEMLKEKGRLIAKPIKGMYGRGIYVIEYDGKYIINNKSYAENEFISFILKLDNYYISEYIYQSDFTAQFYDKTVNTLRFVTIFDSEAGAHVMPIATIKVGTKESYPVDNCDNGGISIKIDMETGKLGIGLKPSNNSKTNRLEYYAHPETGVRFDDKFIPGWYEIKTQILKTTHHFPVLKYIAWDIALTNEGFKVLEINNVPGLGIQMHEPLLELEGFRKNYDMLFR